MILHIDTTNAKKIFLALKQERQLMAEYSEEVANKKQAERLLVAINEFLKQQKMKWSDISSLSVNNQGGSFTGLRLGVLTANTLAYALQLPVKGISNHKIIKNHISIVKPEYDREPDIGKSSIDI